MLTFVIKIDIFLIYFFHLFVKKANFASLKNKHKTIYKFNHLI